MAWNQINGMGWRKSAGSGSPAPTYNWLLEASFDDTNGTPIASFACETGGPLANLKGTVEIQSNAAVALTYSGTEAAATYDIGKANQYSELVCSGSKPLRHIARVNGATDYLLFSCGGTDGDRPQIYANIGGSYSLLVTSDPTAHVGTNQSGKALLYGDDLGWRVTGDTQTLTVTTSSSQFNTETSVGVIFNSASAATGCDDMKSKEAGSFSWP